MIRFLRYSFSIVCILFSSSLAYAATISAQADGNWNSVLTWAGGVVPTAGDDVVILGYDVTVSSGTVTVASIDLQSYAGVFLGAAGRSATLTINNGTGLIVTGDIGLTSREDATTTLPLIADLIIQKGGEATINGDLNTTYSGLTDVPGISLIGTLTVNGLLDVTSGLATIDMSHTATDTPILNINGTFDFSSTRATVDATTPSRINYGGTANHTIYPMNYHHLGVTTSGTVTLNHDFTAVQLWHGSMYIDSGTLDIQTFEIDGIDAGTHNFEMAAGTLLRIDGAGIDRFPKDVDGITLDPNSTVEYYGVATRIENQSETTNVTVNYGNLLISATPTAVVPEGAINIYGDLTIETSSLLNAQTNAINVFDTDRTDKTFTINGAGRIRFTGTNPFCDGFETYAFNASSEVDMNGTNQDIGDAAVDIDFGTLTVRNSGTKTLIGNATVQTACNVTGSAQNILQLNKSLTGSVLNATLSLGDANSELHVNNTIAFPTNFDYSFHAASNTEMNGTTQNVGNDGATNTDKPVVGLLEINGSGTKTLVSDVDAAGDVAINAGTLNLNTFYLTDSNSGSTFTQVASTFLLVDGSTTANDANFPGNFSTYTLAPTSTVHYSKSGTQGIYSTAPTSAATITYGHLIVSGASQSTDIKTLQGDLTGGQTVEGNITISTGSTLDLLTYQIAVNNTAISIESNATLKVGGNNGDDTNNIPTGYSALTPAANSTVNYYMTDVQEIEALAYHHLALDGSDQDVHLKYLADNITCNGNITINDGAHLHLSNNVTSKSLTGNSSILLLNENASMTVTNAFPTNFLIYSLDDNSTVIYNSSSVNADANQTISTQQYGNLECSGGSNSIKTLGGNLTGSKSIAGNLTIDSNTELDTDAFSLNSTGSAKTLTLNDNALLSLGAGVTTSTSAFFNFPIVSISQTHGSEATIDFYGANQNLWCQDGSGSTISGYGNITINGTGTKSLLGDVTALGDLTVYSGTLDMSTFTINAVNSTAGEVFTLSSGTTLLLGSIVSNVSNNMPANFDTYSLDANSTVNLNGVGDQGIFYQEPTSTTPASLVYGHLEVSGTGTKQTTGDISNIAGNVLVSSGTLALNTNDFASDNVGTFTLDPGTFLTISGGDASSSNFPANFSAYSLSSTSTTSYDKNGEQGVYSLSPTSNIAITYGHLIFDGTNNETHTKHLLGALKSGQTIEGDVTVKNGANFDIEAYLVALNNTNLTVEANARLSLSGVSNFPTGYGAIDLQDFSTVDYDLAGNQTLASITYYNLDLTGGGSKTLSGDAGAKGVVDIEDGASLDVGSDFTNYFTFLSVGEGAQETGILGNLSDESTGSVSGSDFKVERLITLTDGANDLFGWNDWATPLKQQKVRNWKYQDGFDIWMSGFAGSHQPWSSFNSVLTYSSNLAAADTSKNLGWVGASSIDDNIDYNHGIRLWYGNLDRTISVIGELNEGTINYASLEYALCTGCETNDPDLGSNDEQSGWNLIGNPYVAPIDFAKIYDASGGSMTNLDPSFWVWSNKYGYSSYNAASDVGNYGTYAYAAISDQSLISSHKAFWVKANASSPSMTITEDAKDINGAVFIKSNVNKKVIKMALTSQDNGLKSGLAIAMLEGAKNTKDVYDSDLFKHQSTPIPYLYALTEDGSKVMIDGVSNQSTAAIPIGMDVPTSGVYEIDVHTMENVSNLSCLYLMDMFTNEVYDLKLNPIIYLTLSDTVKEPQFQLIYNEGPDLTYDMVKVGCDGINNGALSFFVNGNNKATFTLTDTIGNVINEISDAKNATFNNLAAGTYRMYVTGNAAPCATGFQEFEVEQEEATKAIFTASTQELDLAHDAPEVSFTNQSENGFQYQWFVNGVMESTAMDFFYTFTEAGIYEITLVTTNEMVSCIDVSSTLVEVKNSTSINEFSNINNAQVVVRNGKINISKINTKVINNISLMTTDGKTLYSLSRVSSITEMISTENFSAGIYLLELKGNNTSETMKLFIQ